jgi:short-subunit dehydrogenase
MAVYYATKAFVVSFSAALGEELRASGVTVTCLCPGYTKTGFQARARIDSDRTATIPMMSSMAVAEAGYRAMMAGRKRVVTGFGNKIAVAALPLVPHSLVLPIVARLQMKRHA